jgi:hypothetical protein
VSLFFLAPSPVLRVLFCTRIHVIVLFIKLLPLLIVCCSIVVSFSFSTTPPVFRVLFCTRIHVIVLFIKLLPLLIVCCSIVVSFSFSTTPPVFRVFFFFRTSFHVVIWVPSLYYRELFPILYPSFVVWNLDLKNERSRVVK